MKAILQGVPLAAARSKAPMAVCTLWRIPAVQEG